MSDRLALSHRAEDAVTDHLFDTFIDHNSLGEPQADSTFSSDPCAFPRLGYTDVPCYDPSCFDTGSHEMVKVQPFERYAPSQSPFDGSCASWSSIDGVFEPYEDVEASIDTLVLFATAAATGEGRPFSDLQADLSDLTDLEDLDETASKGTKKRARQENDEGYESETDMPLMDIWKRQQMAEPEASAGVRPADELLADLTTLHRPKKGRPRKYAKKTAMPGQSIKRANLKESYEKLEATLHPLASSWSRAFLLDYAADTVSSLCESSMLLEASLSRMQHERDQAIFLAERAEEQLKLFLKEETQREKTARTADNQDRIDGMDSRRNKDVSFGEPEETLHNVRELPASLDLGFHPLIPSMPDDFAGLPSLRPTRTHLSVARPNVGQHTAVVLSGDSKHALAVAASDRVELLDDELHLEDALEFYDAFPSSSSRSTHVNAVASDTSSQRIAAASDDRVAIWNKTAKSGYKVHSTLSTGFPIECLDLCGDILISGGHSLAIYGLQDSSGLPTWSRRYFQKLHVPASSVKLSKNGQLIACSFKDHHIVQISRLSDINGKTSLSTISETWHTKAVRHIEWLQSSSPSGNMILLTQTIDGISRIWRCLPDEPDFYVLWCTVHPSFLLGSPVLQSYWIPSSIIANDAFISVSKEGRLAITRIQNLHQPATSAAVVSSELLADIALPREQLSRLRYSLSLSRSEKLCIFGLSKHAGAALFTVSPTPASDKLLLERTRAHRHRASQRICLMASTGDGRYVVSVGEAGETILWRSKRVGQKTACVDAVACHRPQESEGKPRYAAVSSDASIVAVVSEHDLQLFETKGQTRLIPLESDIPSAPPPADILAVSLLVTLETKLYLVLVDRKGIIRVWTYQSVSFKLVFTSTHPSAANRAHIVTSEDDTSARIALASEEQRISTYALSLDGSRTTCRTESDGSTAPLPGSINLLCCAAASFIASVTKQEGRDVLRIHNTQSSLFASGLEYIYSFSPSDEVRNIAFAVTSDDIPLLLVTLSSRVVVISQNRLDYYKENSLWLPVASTSVHSRHSISSITYLSYDSSILAAAGSNTYLLSASLLQPAQTYGHAAPSTLTLLVSRINAPLPDYHPQLLMQCLLAGKSNLVDSILLRLARAVKANEDDDDIPFSYNVLPATAFIEDAQHAGSSNSDFFVNSLQPNETQTLSEEDVQRLYKSLSDSSNRLELSLEEREHLRVLIETVLQCEAQRRALDTNGMRFLISLRSFAITQSHVSSTPQPSRPPSPTSSIRSKRFLSHPLARLRYRDILWGYHSESQEILLAACSDVCNGPMMWEDARALGISLWVRSPEVLATQLETIAKNEYTAPEDRDPTTCSLYYFALRKKRLVQGLWRQATFHKERGLMLKFLTNDFTESRWKSAALKNAFALMGKQRFHYAAAFFLLGDSLKDCVNVCLRQLNDFHLAVIIARVYEGDSGPVLRDILNNHVLPLAFSRGYRRLASWAFWLLKRRDLAVRVIVTPLSELVPVLDNPAIKEAGNPAQEDPSLVLLYGQLRDWSLQTLKGSSAISPLRETQFILHIAQVFRRMGCHVLALDLVRNWEYRSARDQIFALLHKDAKKAVNGYASDRPALQHRRRSSLLAPKRRSTIILDVPSAVQSRAVSPERQPAMSKSPQAEEQEGFKKVVREVKAPPPEFDMSSFGF